MPRMVRGLDLDLNQSLAGDGLTTRGEAYRNASVRDLCEFAGPRGAVRLSKDKALELVSGPLASAISCSAFATDVMPGSSVMDVEEFEGRLASVRVPRGAPRAQGPARPTSLRAPRWTLHQLARGETQ